MVHRIKGYAYVAIEHVRYLVELIQVGYIMIAFLVGGILGYLIGKKT